MKDLLLFRVWQYLAAAIAVGGLLLRWFLMARDSRTSGTSPRSSGGPSWVRGIWWALAGAHFFAFLFPGLMLRSNGVAWRFSLLEGLGLAIGAGALAAGAVTLWRHFAATKPSFVEEIVDSVFLALLTAALSSGVAITISRQGGSWLMLFAERLHVFSSFTLLALLPFTRFGPPAIAAMGRALTWARRPALAGPAFVATGGRAWGASWSHGEKGPGLGPDASPLAETGRYAPMYRETVDALAIAARKKANFLRHNALGYFVASALAGAYVGFGIVLVFSIGAPLAAINAAARQALMGASFGVALSLVIFAGSELFTGNNLVMTCGLWKSETTLRELVAVWMVSWVGNLAGSFLLAAMVHWSGGELGKSHAFVGAVAAAKMSAPIFPLFMKAILCNWLVCLAVWMSVRMSTESGKLIMIFWCLFAFFGSGFEHSVANMTLLSLAMLGPQLEGVTWYGWAFNLAVVTAGNIVGGALAVGGAYCLASRGSRVVEVVAAVGPSSPISAPSRVPLAESSSPATAQPNGETPAVDWVVGS